jgi:hypothetical protein
MAEKGNSFGVISAQEPSQIPVMGALSELEARARPH